MGSLVLIRPASGARNTLVGNGTGALAGQGVTPLVRGANGTDEVGGTWGFLLTDVITTGIPAGVVKVTVDGAGPSAATFLQFSGDSTTSLQTAQDIVAAAVSNPVTVR